MKSAILQNNFKQEVQLGLSQGRRAILVPGTLRWGFFFLQVMIIKKHLKQASGNTQLFA
ncbi:hypothetical protein [Rheinheimera gaetbuli]